jgi:dihydroorotate dehydrogenase (NAD+) catalytic subunit
MVWQVRQAVEVPIIGMGGIASGEDAVEFLLAGANAVAAGTALFADPLTPVKIKNFVLQYMKEQNAGCLSDICGAVTLNR